MGLDLQRALGLYLRTQLFAYMAPGMSGLGGMGGVGRGGGDPIMERRVKKRDLVKGGFAKFP